MRHLGHDSRDELRRYCDQNLPTAWSNICSHVLDHPQFVEAPGGTTRHHNYRGGLAEHTLEVAKVCIEMTETGRDTWRILTAAVFHDFGKIYEYEFQDDATVPSGEKIVALPFRDLIRHVAYSFSFFWSVSLSLREDDRMQIGHAILAHHGRKEWGSPVEPQTRIACIIHAADMESMRSQGKERLK